MNLLYYSRLYERDKTALFREAKVVVSATSLEEIPNPFVFSDALQQLPGASSSPGLSSTSIPVLKTIISKLLLTWGIPMIFVSLGHRLLRAFQIYDRENFENIGYRVWTQLLWMLLIEKVFRVNLNHTY